MLASEASAERRFKPLRLHHLTIILNRDVMLIKATRSEFYHGNREAVDGRGGIT